MFHIDGIEKDQLDSMHPACRDVLQYWQARTEAVGGIPKLIDIDLMDLWIHASFITIKDIERNYEARAMRFRWRYAGTMMYKLTGQELTGQYMDDVFDPKDEVIDAEEKIALSGNLHFWKRSIQNVATEQTPTVYESLTLPLANNYGSIGHTMAIIVWSEDELEESRSSLSFNGQHNDPVTRDGILVTQ